MTVVSRCWVGPISSLGSIVFQSVNNNPETRSFADTQESCTVRHLCMTLCILMYANKIFCAKYFHEHGLFNKFAKNIVAYSS